MDRLKRARRPDRALITKTVTELGQELTSEHPNVDSIQAKLERLDKCSNKVGELNDQILNLMLDDDCTDEDYDNEKTGIAEYEDKVSLVKIQAMKLLRAESIHGGGGGSDNESTTSSVKKRNFKLPKIELRKFGGNLKDWLGFWAQFQKIHEDNSLDISDKFQYLVQAMEINSRPWELVESYPQSVENYPKAVAALKSRFGKDELLVEVYVRELLKLVICNVNNPKEKVSISQMYDKLESQLRALESLGVTSEKYAAMLFPLVESSLPEEVLRAWQRSSLSSRDGSTEVPPRTRLSFLMEFLKNEVEGEERISLARAGFGMSLSSTSKVTSNKKKFSAQADDFPTAVGLFSGDVKQIKCIFCDKPHESKDCFKAHSMSMEEKKELIQSKKACFYCLKPGHTSKMCKAMIKCIICSKKHVVLVCPNLHSNQKSGEVKKSVDNKDKVATTQDYLNCTSEVLLQTLTVNIRNQENGLQKQVRVLCDPGSQRSYILRKTATELGFEPFSGVKLCHLLFGGSHDTQDHQKYKVQLVNIVGDFSQMIEVLDHKQICGPIPRASKGSWLKKLKKFGIRLSDVGDGTPEIELLIGSDYYLKLLTGKIVDLNNGLSALETRFGWTVAGKRNNLSEDPDSSIAMAVTSMSVTDASLSELWDLETIGIRDPAESKSKQEKEEAAKEHFLKTVTRNENGRYSVGLPWVDEVQKLPSNRTIAERRLDSTTSKLRAVGKLEAYNDVFNSWLAEGIIEEVPEHLHNEMAHYLPHRGVIKTESMTTPIRPVFDASCKGFRCPSLNDCLEKGPNLIELIPSILLRFREKKIGVVSDIRKAFLMVEIKESDRDFLRFLWWEDPATRKLKVFRHRRVVFGVRSSPFLLGAVIEYHLKQVENQPVADQLLKSLYVDNCITSVDSIEDYKMFKDQATQMMADAKMELRQWECSSVLSGIDRHSRGGLDVNRTSIPIELNSISSVLGLKWNKAEDTLSCDLNSIELPEIITRRVIMSVIHRIFDPIGFACPTVLQPKLILQKTWESKVGWDSELADDIKLQFRNWCEDLRCIQEIKIPRNATAGVTSRESWQLHTFCDASQEAYAAAVFLRTTKNNQISVQLLQAKSRVAPIKKITIPRLELLACTIAARLTSSVKEALSLTDIPCYYWSDSTTALAWVRRNDDWGTFVGNRVKEICKLTEVQDWRHVPGVMNPADLPSRGCSPQQLLKSKWWEGPGWLKCPESEWPNEDIIPDEELVITERKKNATLTMLCTSPKSLWYVERSNSYFKNIRIIGWIRRFIEKARKKSEQTGMLQVSEFQDAEKVVLKIVQKEMFPEVGENISGLLVLRETDGLIHVKTRVLHRDDTAGFRLPILLPNCHAIVDQLIMEVHLEHGHAGVQFLMGKLREKVWILQGRKAIRRVLNKCVNCLRFTAKKIDVDPVALPGDRVNNANVFEITGVDLAGPLYLKNRSKAWVVLYTCAVYRCVHLDFVLSLSTEAFIDSLERFINARGRPKTMYSDNGTNFLGTNNSFKKLNWKKIEQKCQVKQIQWKFNPPTAAWWGGWWERLVRSLKDLLKRMLGQSRLDSEQLRTCLSSVEATINDRPLTTVTEDQEDLIPLTPAMFMRGINSASFPEVHSAYSTDLQENFRRRKTILAELQSRFRKEYLSQLVQRGNEKKGVGLKVGDVVLVGADNKKKLEWPMARILELLPGKDGKVRVARVKTATGVLLRPLQRLYPLEISSIEDSPIFEKIMAVAENIKADVPVQTKCGRQVKVPVRFGQ